MTRNKILMGGVLLAALLFTLFLIPTETTTRDGAKRTSLLGKIATSVGDRFSAQGAIETLPGFNETHYRALPEKEKAAYHEYLIRLDRDVGFLKAELKEEKPRFDTILQNFFPERMQSLSQPHDSIDSTALGTPEAAQFMKKQAEERGKGATVIKLDLLQEMLIRYGPRLTREEKKKIENEIGQLAAALGH